MSQFEISNRYHSQGLAAGGSALLDAITKGKVHLAKFILDAGEYDVVNTRDFKGKTPLIRACYIKEEKTRDKAVRLLLSKNADVNLRDENERTALSYACEMRCNDMVKILVKNNVDPGIPDISGNTALIYSAMVGNDVAIDVLIRSFRRLGLNVDHVNNEGLTALLVAAKNGFIACATLLATDGRANLSVRDPKTKLNAEELARLSGCSTTEVLLFSPSSQNQLRAALNRCGSMYAAPNAGGTCGAGTLCVVGDMGKLTVSGATGVDGCYSGDEGGGGSGGGTSDEGEDTRDGRGERQNGGGSGRKMRAVTAGFGQFGAGMQRRGAGEGGKRNPRHKRNSLPCIKLHSSLDSPGTYSQRLTSSPLAEEEGPTGAVLGGVGPNRAALTMTTDRGQSPAPLSPSSPRTPSSSAGGSCLPEVIPSRAGFIDQISSNVTCKVAVGPRRSRELQRADTDVTYLE